MVAQYLNRKESYEFNRHKEIFYKRIDTPFPAILQKIPIYHVYGFTVCIANDSV